MSASPDPIVDMAINTTPAPVVESTAPVQDSGSTLSAAPGEASGTDASPGSLPPAPELPKADPVAALGGRIAQIEQAIQQIAQSRGQTVQQATRQVADTDPELDDIDPQAGVLRKLMQSVDELKGKYETRERVDRAYEAQSKIAAEVNAGHGILNELGQSFDFTRENPKVHETITKLLMRQITPIIKSNPFQHGITADALKSEYVELAREMHAGMVEALNRKRQDAVEQKKANDATSAIPGGTTPAALSNPNRSKRDPLTDDGFWNESGQRLQSKIDALLNQ